MRILKAGACAAALLTLMGCGYVGEPLPPLANIPERVGDLAVVQRGAGLIVQFTAPKLTTEGMAIKRGLKLDLRAGPAGAPFNAEEWAAGARRAEPVPDEQGHVRTTVSTSGWAGREAVVAVKAIGANGKDTGWADFKTVTVVAAPEMPRNVTAQSVPEGVRLVWQAAGAAFRVFRREGNGAFAVVGKADRPEWTDATAEPAKPYTYLVQTAVPAGQGEAESEPSAEVRITPEDRFPPAAPAGLEVVASPVSMELAWTPNTEPDLSLYRVYRAVASGEFEKLAETAGVPAYSDRTVERGKTYRYAVSAVDRAGNESARSAVAQTALP